MRCWINLKLQLVKASHRFHRNTKCLLITKKLLPPGSKCLRRIRSKYKWLFSNQYSFFFFLFLQQICLHRKIVHQNRTISTSKKMLKKLLLKTKDQYIFNWHIQTLQSKSSIVRQQSFRWAKLPIKNTGSCQLFMAHWAPRLTFFSGI